MPRAWLPRGARHRSSRARRSDPWTLRWLGVGSRTRIGKGCRSHPRVHEMTVALDSWAVLRLLEGSGAAAKAVGDLLATDRPLISWINLGEVHYVLQRIHGEDAATETVRDRATCSTSGFQTSVSCWMPPRSEPSPRWRSQTPSLRRSASQRTPHSRPPTPNYSSKGRPGAGATSGPEAVAESTTYPGVWGAAVTESPPQQTRTVEHIQVAGRPVGCDDCGDSP